MDSNTLNQAGLVAGLLIGCSVLACVGFYYDKVLFEPRCQEVEAQVRAEEALIAHQRQEIIQQLEQL